MAIDRELIREAKERLGDRNFDLIMDALDVAEYDRRNMRCACVWHNEKTPSLLYDRKSYRVHCFGCGKSSDLIDALIENKHMTFNEAAERIFSEANMAVPMPEVGLKDKGVDYVYPTLSDGDMTPAYEYLAQRGISKAVVDYVGIKCDDKGIMEFPFYSFGDVLTMVKCRPARKVIKGEGAKCWVKKGTGSAPLLFNANRINTELPLIITEGCIDALAVMECGYFNVVSVPLGSQNLSWVSHNLEWLDQFTDIILCGDADDAGRKMNIEASSRLGVNRCRFFPHPVYKANGKLMQINDINECLFRLGKERLKSIFDEVINAPNPSFIDFTEIEDIDWSQVDGISFGLDEVDKVLHKMYRGSVNTFYAKPSAGKSSYVNQVMARAISDGRKVCLYTGELSEPLWKNWFSLTMAGRQNIKEYVSENGYKYYKVSPKALLDINKCCKNQLFVYRDDKSSNIDDIIDACIDMIRRQGVSVVVFDNLMTLDCDEKGGELEEQKVIMKKLQKLAKDHNIVVILICHAKKVKEALTMEDASGSFKIANLSGIMMTLERNNDKFQTGYDVMLKIQKDRFNGRNNYEFPVRFDFPSRRFFTSEEELNRSFSWTEGECTVDELPQSEALERMYANQSEEQEVFGA